MQNSTKYFAGIYSGIALGRRATLTSHGESDSRPVFSWLLIDVEPGRNNGTEGGCQRNPSRPLSFKWARYLRQEVTYRWMHMHDLARFLYCADHSRKDRRLVTLVYSSRHMHLDPITSRLYKDRSLGFLATDSMRLVSLKCSVDSGEL